MDGRAFVITLVALSLLSMTLAPWTYPSTVMADGTDCPPPDFSMGTSVFHQIIMLQGNDPDTETQEAKGNVQMIQRTYWRIPWDSDEVYMSVPTDAADLSLDHVDSVPHQGSSVFIPGRYSLSHNPDDPPETGRVSGGDFDGFYYWRFPSMADRDTDATLAFNTTEDFEDYDDNFTDPEEWEISNGTLTLAGNVSSATYTSKMYLGGEGIKSVNLTYDGLVMENMSLEITIDNGTTWMTVENGKTVTTEEEEGNEFRWRVTMTQNVSDPLPPVLDVVTAEVEFTPPWTEIWLEASYSMWIPKEGLVFDLQFPFDPETPGLIFVSYVDLDVELTVTGMEVTRTPGGKYPDKATYTHMMSTYTCTVTFEFTYHVEPGTDPDLPWLLYVIPLVLVVLIGLLYYFSTGSGKEPSEDEPGEDGDEPDGEDGDGTDLDDMDGAELEERKAMLLGSIKRLEQEHAEGTVGDEELEIRRDMYKKEAVEVMRRLHEMTSEDD